MNFDFPANTLHSIQARLRRGIGSNPTTDLCAGETGVCAAQREAKARDTGVEEFCALGGAERNVPMESR